MKSFATLLDIRGQTFTRLTVIDRAANYKNGSARWRCRCECGNEVIAIGQKLRDGRVKSCGCYNRDVARQRMQTHGESSTRLFKIWGGMLNRCSNPRCHGCAARAAGLNQAPERDSGLMPTTYLHQKPGQRLAFVPDAAPELIAETLVALANSEGGTLVLGANAKQLSMGDGRSPVHKQAQQRQAEGWQACSRGL